MESFYRIVKYHEKGDYIFTFCKNILRYSLNNNEKEVIESKDKEL